jgi:hypothetical protein
MKVGQCKPKPATHCTWTYRERISNTIHNPYSITASCNIDVVLSTFLTQLNEMSVPSLRLM